MRPLPTEFTFIMKKSRLEIMYMPEIPKVEKAAIRE